MAIKCNCDITIPTGISPHPQGYYLISEADAEALDRGNSVTSSECADDIVRKGLRVYRCENCGRLLLFWQKGRAAQFYIPEATKAMDEDAPRTVESNG